MDFSNSAIYQKLLSDNNIYLAIFSLDKTMQNRELLDEDDAKLFMQLKDKYNKDFIMKTVIPNVKQRIKKIVCDDELFTATVYFKPKKPVKDEKSSVKAEFRPLHSVSLYDYITIIAMMNVILYDYEDLCHDCDATCKEDKCQKKMKLTLSNLCRLIPSHFYGNRISNRPDSVYLPWQKQYSEYTSEASTLFSRYHKTREYRYEVDLDIEDFFPSVNPLYILKYITEKLPITYSALDLQLLKMIIFKLLCMKIDKQRLDKKIYQLYYKKNCNEVSDLYTVGIPQGLPQAYFFANICMIEVARQYDMVFKGKAIFYVDDSIIFTNELKHNETDRDFNNKLQELNKKLSNIQIEFDQTTEAISKQYTQVFHFHNDRKYIIRVHENDEKSSYTDVINSKFGELHLTNLCRETSMIAADINSSFSDIEDITLRSRLTKLVLEIDNEINYIDKNTTSDNSEEIESYRKKLIRYKKFFKYREMILKYREDMNYKELFDKQINKYIDNVSAAEFVRVFFEYYNEDILVPALTFYIKTEQDYVKSASDLEVKTDHQEKVRAYLKKLNRILFGFDNIKSSYIYKAFQFYIENKEYQFMEVNRYSSLRQYVKKIVPRFYNVHKEIREKFLKDTICNLDDSCEITKRIFDEDFYKVLSIVDYNTDEIKRVVLNTIVSYIYNIEIDDSYSFMKKENRMMTYKELRIISYVRNKYFSYKNFLQKVDEFVHPDNEVQIDYNILEVINRFRVFVKNPERIDDLIRIHKYTCDVWKNGSKYLYFYTLHNQEHAVDLIKNSIQIVKIINFINIKSMDYYILFMACYLHDISMVTLPALEKFQNNKKESNLIYSDFVKDFTKDLGVDFWTNDKSGDELKQRLKDNKFVKNILKEYYKRLDSYYENEVRSKHAIDSGREIRNRSDLNFIEACLREVVAEVSEAHGFTTDEVYKSKSVAAERLYSKKYMQIILRLADLLDMSEYRVSKPILNNNLENMSRVSSFHWISHLLTEGFKIEVNYTTDDTLSIGKDFISYLQPKRITECLNIEVRVKMSQMSKVDCNRCRHMQLIDDSITKCGFQYDCGKGECNSDKCNFLCKWFTEKNYYLFLELQELQRYLNDNADNFFKSDIKVSVKIVATTNLTTKQFDILDQQLNNQ